MKYYKIYHTKTKKYYSTCYPHWSPKGHAYNTLGGAKSAIRSSARWKQLRGIPKDQLEIHEFIMGLNQIFPIEK